jgi:hypothetical protein
LRAEYAAASPQAEIGRTPRAVLATHFDPRAALAEVYNSGVAERWRVRDCPPAEIGATGESSIPLGFTAGVVGAIGVFVTGCLLVSSREWFVADDFAFLFRVQQVEPWSWLDIRTAFKAYWWPFYRPLGMESFYYANYRLFGLNFTGFVLTALLVNLVTGWLVYRIAVGLGFDARAAAAAAVLSITCYATALGLFRPSRFHYTFAIFLVALSVSLFLEYLRRGHVRHQIAGCAALALGLLCNEVMLMVPGILALISLCTEHRVAPWLAVLRAIRRVSPQLLVAVAYLPLRFWLFDLRDPPRFYRPSFGPHVVRNVGDQLLYVFGSHAAPIVAVSLAVLVLAAACLRSEGRERATGWLFRVNFLCIGWMALALMPFVPFPRAEVRWSAVLSIPMGLFFASYADLLWRTWGRRHPRTIELGLVGLLLVSLPYEALWQKASNPTGAETKRLTEVVETYAGGPGTRTRFLVLYGSPGLATKRTFRRFNRRLFGGIMPHAVFPRNTVKLEFVDLSRPREMSEPRPRSKRKRPWTPLSRCVYLTLGVDGTIELADHAFVNSVFEPAKADRCLSRSRS